MPLARILKQAFTEGIEKISKEDLAKLFAAKGDVLGKEGAQKVFRKDLAAKTLMEEGFDPELARRGPLLRTIDEHNLARLKGSPEEAHSALRRGLTREEEDALIDKSTYASDIPSDYRETLRKELYDTPGLYWSGGQTARGNALPPYQKSGELIEGITRPNAQVMMSDLQADFLIRGTDLGEDLIQQKPGNVLARLGDKYKIIGLGAAMGLGSQLGEPEEAEAGIFTDLLKKGIGPVQKATAKAAKGMASSSEQALIGQEVMGGIVKQVTKGEQGWRYLIFEDGTQKPFKKEVITALCREYGTKGKMAELAGKGESEKLGQAIKSLNYHSQRQKDFTTQAMRDDYRNEHYKMIKALGIEPEEMAHIDEPIKAYIPKEYVNILEQAGMIKIKPRKKQVK